jgi:basic amino acid/polyamine antiporter, APA family
VILVRRTNIVTTGRSQSSFTLVEIVAFVFAIWTIYTFGPEAVLYGLLLLPGIPLYLWMRNRGQSLERPFRERLNTI